MNLDAHILQFSLLLTNVFMVVSLFVAAVGRVGNGKRDGLGKWAVATR
jgi:hypothetical protein